MSTVRTPSRAPAAPGHDRLRDVSLPVAVFVAFLLLWAAFVAVSGIAPYLMPPPEAVGGSLWRGLTAPLDSSASLLGNLFVTLQAAGGGLLFGVVLGCGLGAIAAVSRLVDSIVSPYVFGLQGLPKVAIAPLLMIWFGFGTTTKIILSAFLVFFPMYVNTYTGIRNVPHQQLRLLRAMGASRFQELTMVRLPNALVMVLAGLEIAVVQCLLGALVGEFISARAGMGILLLQFQAVNNTAGMFAGLILLALVGLLAHRAVVMLRKRLIYWQSSS